MKMLRITASGLPLFKQELDLVFYAQQRVREEDKERLFDLGQNMYLHMTNAFIGINASGKTSVLKVIQLALSILKNEPINHVDAKTILGGAEKAVLNIYFLDKENKVCRLETEIASTKGKSGEYTYHILDERLWEKSLRGVKSKKYLTDFQGMDPVSRRSTDELFLSDDVSFIIAHNKQLNDNLELCSLLS